MIVVDKLTKYFDNVPAVKNVSFEVREGERLVLLGTSGSGKTTTLRMINRLIEPSSGNVYINGKSIFSQPAEQLRRSIGYVLQNHGLFPHYTVAENIAVVPRLLGWDKENTQRRVISLLKKLQLPPERFGNAYPEQLSGGQQQRIGLARAVAANPPILLMDEPFGALDPVTRANIRKEFMELDELKKRTILLVTHDVQEAFDLADRICLMDGGMVQQLGRPADLLFRPANDFVKSFFSGQRLLLELKAIKLLDVWQQLKDDSGDSTGEKQMTAGQSLWEAMEYFSQPDLVHPTLTIINEQSKQRKRIRVSDIIDSLNQFKQT